MPIECSWSGSPGSTRTTRGRRPLTCGTAGWARSWREDVTTYYSFDVVSKLMALVDAKAAGVAKALDVEQLDLMPLLERSLDTYYDCFHCTPAGARAIATAVAAAVLRQPLPSVRAATAADDAIAGKNQQCVALRASRPCVDLPES